MDPSSHVHERELVVGMSRLFRNISSAQGEREAAAYAGRIPALSTVRMCGAYCM